MLHVFVCFVVLDSFGLFQRILFDVFGAWASTKQKWCFVYFFGYGAHRAPQPNPRHVHLKFPHGFLSVGIWHCPLICWCLLVLGTAVGTSARLGILQKCAKPLTFEWRRLHPFQEQPRYCEPARMVCHFASLWFWSLHRLLSNRVATKVGHDGRDFGICQVFEWQLGAIADSDTVCYLLCVQHRYFQLHNFQQSHGFPSFRPSWNLNHGGKAKEPRWQRDVGNFCKSGHWLLRNAVEVRIAHWRRESSAISFSSLVQLRIENVASPEWSWMTYENYCNNKTIIWMCRVHPCLQWSYLRSCIFMCKHRILMNCVIT